MEAGAWSCGLVAGLIHDIPTVKELIDRIMADAERIVRERLTGYLQGVESRGKRCPLDISSEFFQLSQNARIRDQRLTVKNPTARAHHGWGIEASGLRGLESPLRCVAKPTISVA